jgi:hypothetical protein
MNAVSGILSLDLEKERQQKGHLMNYPAANYGVEVSNPHHALSTEKYA